MQRYSIRSDAKRGRLPVRDIAPEFNESLERSAVVVDVDAAWYCYYEIPKDRRLAQCYAFVGVAV